MIEQEKIKQIIEEKLAASDHYLVDVAVKPGNLIVVEIDHDKGVSTADCEALSRYLESQLDRETDDYTLEVGSTGITAPFKTLRQYRKNTGNEIEWMLKNGMKQTGILQSADEKGIHVSVSRQVKPEGAKRKITVQEEEFHPFDEIKYAKYILRFK
ncbi:MAG: ribosome assembly cofactor RimP [Tannerellaceae bacterium]|jgi:ribosome maturation factor RimP|nr:ribosome assembly cofactor RimP [Tannerellaceae bacterium]